MAKQVQVRRGTTVQHATFTGASGELSVDTDKKALILHDGTTAGGHELPKLVTGKILAAQLPTATDTALGLIELATAAEVNTATDITRAVVPSTLLSGVKNHLNVSGTAPMYACRTWVNFDGTNTSIVRGSGNVSSITDNGVGDYTANLILAIQDTNYLCTPTGGQGLGVRYEFTQTVSTVRMLTVNTSSGAASDPDIVGFALFR